MSTFWLKIKVLISYECLASCYFEWLDHYIILVTSIARLLNIAPTFSIYSFITCCNITSCIALTMSCSGLGDIVFLYVSWLFWFVIDCLLSILVTEAYLPSCTSLVCMLAGSIRSYDSTIIFGYYHFRNLEKNFFVNPYKSYSFVVGWIVAFAQHIFNLFGFLFVDSWWLNSLLRIWCIWLYKSRNFVYGRNTGN